MKSDEILAVLDSVAERLCDEGFPNRELEEARAFIASALGDAERYRWLRDPNEVYNSNVRLYDAWQAGPDAFDTAIDTARAAAAGGEGVL